MKRYLWFGIGAAALFYFEASGQTQPAYQREVSAIPVTDSAGPVPYPFLGGVDSPKEALLDIDNDGDLDLFLLMEDGQLNFFRNAGTPASHNFTLEKQSLIDASVGSWFRFADINGDGKKDLFCDNGSSKVRYYRNVSVNPAEPGGLAFSFGDSAFQNLIAEFNNIPAFADLDGDGDLDFFAGRQTGTLAFYRNEGTAASPNFSFVTDFYDDLSTFETAPPCTALASAPPTPPKPPFPPVAFSSAPEKTSGHGANNIEFADIDSDGDGDFFWGDINNINLYFFENQGNAGASDLVKVSNCYLPFETFGFNTPSFGDLDGDGDLDGLVGAANPGNNIDNLVYLLNFGTPNAPDFIVLTENFIRSMDVGNFCSPQMVDIDGDCDRDLITGSANGTLYFYRNTGTGGAPVFQLETSNFGNLNFGEFNSTPIPVFVDIDADGDLDLFVGTDGDGTISFYRNAGNAQTPAFSLVSSQYLGLTVNTLPVCAFSDIDGDGDFDLFVGEWKFTGNANVRFYRNQGTAQNPNFVLELAQLLPPGSRIQTFPTLADYDGDSDYDLFVGGLDGTIQLFQNDGTPASFSFTPIAGSYANIDVGFWAAPAFWDMEGDGDLDLLVGTRQGGVFLYRNTAPSALLKGDVNADGSLSPADAVTLIYHAFNDICFPAPFQAGDVTCDGSITPADLILVLYIIFSNGQSNCP
ncbi:MAG: FG-GAP-like repeat-containing protein [candidate division Zixibacteria bacterium]|nr:FG-GAP-like repeat-containing protein [candidate division Zixibacteria bacterium]MCI0595029.1 FG-GAP-like repeat-containing protein [candidate division Zixibacteria bacterium]